MDMTSLLSKASRAFRCPWFPIKFERWTKLVEMFSIKKCIWPFEYQTFWSSDFKWSVCGFVLCTRPTIWIPNQYIRKQDGIYLSSIQMFGLSGIQMVFKKPDHLASNLFWPFEYQTSWVFRSPLYSGIWTTNISSTLMVESCQMAAWPG